MNVPAPPAAGAPASSTVDEWLRRARDRGLERTDAHALLAVAMQRPRAWLLAHGEAPLGPAAEGRYAALVARRVGGEPLAYLLGEKEFFGLRLQVCPDVLVPRPDTETLVEWALALIPPGAPWRIADLGTGSGAVGLALAQQRPRARVCMLDSSASALRVARDNARALGLAAECLESDWFGALSGRRFELIVSNPPYLAADDPHLPALSHEPARALVSGADGLDALRRICADASAFLEPGAWLLLEHGWAQAPAVAALLAKAGLQDVTTRKDLSGHPRCTGARR